MASRVPQQCVSAKVSIEMTQLGGAQNAKPRVITAVPLSADQCDAPTQINILREAVQMATSYASLLSRGRLSVDCSPQQLRAKLQEHLGVLHTKYNVTSVEERAEADAADFVMPEEALIRDRDSVRSEGSLLQAIKTKLAASKGDRFNGDRCKAMFSGGPEYDTLMDITVHGARIDVDPSVPLSHIPPPLRAKQLRNPKTVLKHAYKVWAKGGGMIIRKTDIPESELHLCSFSSSHHVKKVDVVAEKSAPGRWALDTVALNTNAYKKAAIKRYGKVVLPTLESIVVKWLCFEVANNVSLRECRMMKDDINAAFPQCDFTLNQQCC